MQTILNKNVIKELFHAFPEMKTMWVKGNLDTMESAEFIVDRDTDAADVMKYIDLNLITDVEVEDGPITFGEAFMQEKGYFTDEYVMCTQKDYV